MHPHLCAIGFQGRHVQVIHKDHCLLANRRPIHALAPLVEAPIDLQAGCDLLDLQWLDAAWRQRGVDNNSVSIAAAGRDRAQQVSC